MNFYNGSKNNLIVPRGYIFQDSELTELKNELKTNKDIQFITLKELENIEPEEISEILMAIVSQQVIALDLSSTPVKIESLALFIGNNPHLKTLNLSNIYLGQKSFGLLADMLDKNIHPSRTSLNTLYLKNTGIHIVHADDLNKILRSNLEIENIELSGNPIDDEFFEKISDFFSNKKLHSVLFEKTDISDNSLLKLTKNLGESIHLTHVGLSQYKNIKATTWITVAKNLSSLSKLVFLDFSSNNIGNAEVNEMANHIFKKNKNLKKINLIDNQIGNQDSPKLDDFFKIMMNYDARTQLGLSYNYLDQRTVYNQLCQLFTKGIHVFLEGNEKIDASLTDKKLQEKWYCKENEKDCEHKKNNCINEINEIITLNNIDSIWEKYNKIKHSHESHDKPLFWGQIKTSNGSIDTTQWRLIHFSIWYADAPFITTLLKEGKYHFKVEQPTLHIFAISPSKMSNLGKTIAQIIGAGEPWDSTDHLGNTFLHAAIDAKKEDLVTIILEQYPELTLIENKNKERPYDLAKKNNFRKNDLIKHEIFLLAQQGNLERIKDLEASGVDILIKNDKDGRNIYLLAAMNGHYKIIEYLNEKFNHNQDSKYGHAINEIDYLGNNAFHLAAQYGHHEIFQLLIHLNTNDKNKDNQCILHIAILHRQIACVEAFMKLIFSHENEKAYVELGMPKRKMQYRPIEIAVALGDRQSLSLLTTQKKIQINNIDLLHTAMQFNQLNIFIELIMTHHLNPKTENAEGLNCLHHAAFLGNIDFTEYLLTSANEMINLPCRQKGKTAAHYAAEKGNLEILKRIKKSNDANFYLLDFEKKLPIHLAENTHHQHSVLQIIEGSITDDFFYYENLVFQGGGPKGIGYGGALQTLTENLPDFLKNIKKVGGTSAGAITAAFLAVGYDIAEIKALLEETSFHQFLDYQTDITYEKIIEEAPSFLLKIKQPTEVETLQLLWNEYWKTTASFTHKYETINQHKGLCAGETLRVWLEEKISSKIRALNPDKAAKNPNYGKYLTFGELSDLYKSNTRHQYKHLYLVLTKLVYTIEALPEYINSEDEKWKSIIISDAIRASASLPIIYIPHKLYRKNEDGLRVVYSNEVFIDGGITNNYPIELFDTNAGVNDKTLGFSLLSSEKLTAIKTKGHHYVITNNDVEQISKSTIMAIINYEDISKHNLAHVQRRTIYVDPLDVKTTDFNLSKERLYRIMQSGKKGALKFLINKGLILEERNEILNDITENTIFTEENCPLKPIATSSASCPIDFFWPYILMQYSTALIKLGLNFLSSPAKIVTEHTQPSAATATPYLLTNKTPVPMNEILLLTQIPVMKIGIYREKKRAFNTTEIAQLEMYKRQFIHLNKKLKFFNVLLNEASDEFSFELNHIVNRLRAELIPAVNSGTGSPLLLERVERLLGYLKQRILILEQQDPWVNTSLKYTI